MNEIILASVIWVGTHLGLSSPPVRRRLTAVTGEQGFLGLYSLVALASLAYLIWVYTQVPRATYLWLPDPDLFWVAKVLMPIAMVLMVGGFMVKNPTLVGMQLDTAEAGDLARGVTRITRHPFQWAVVLWAIGHIVANGDLVSVVFFSAFLLVSLLGTLLMDAKKASSFGEAWQIYANSTSNVPFVAVLRGTNKLELKELWLPVLAGLLVYALLYRGHEYFTGTVVI